MASVAAPFALFAVLQAATGGSGGDPTTATATAAPPQASAAPSPPTVTASVVASASSASTAQATAALAPPPADGRIDGLDAAEWRRALRAAPAASDWSKGAAAVIALQRLEPAALADPDMRNAAGVVAAAVEIATPDRAGPLLDALAAGREGMGVLFDLVTRRGGSKAAAHAGEVLRRPEVRARATPALRIALDLRDEPCGSKEALLDRAVQEGDEVALAYLGALGSPHCKAAIDGCCLRDNDNVEQAMKALSARLHPDAAASARPRAPATAAPATASPVTPEPPAPDTPPPPAPATATPPAPATAAPPAPATAAPPAPPTAAPTTAPKPPKPSSPDVYD